MKKTSFTVILIAFSAYGAMAQGISGGLKAGVNFANHKWSLYEYSGTRDSRTGFNFGGYLNFGFSKTFSVQPELIYNGLGVKSNDTDFKSEYISVPIMLKYNPVPIFNIHAGPQVGFLISAKSYDVDVKHNTKALDMGLGLGAGVDLPMGLGITGRYVMGLTNISKNFDDVSEDFSVKNTVFQFSLTYELFGGE